ncbi:MAG: DUF6468 domain-containing protein [Alphaproteobacteria bacterium]|nr:DUF6468 domain-containing protein [Alphaproteobacteria bacterium]
MNFQMFWRSSPKNIDQANAAILGMKEASRSSGEHLQELIDQARLLTDELNLINQAGDSLAGRLENLAEKNRKIVRDKISLTILPITRRSRVTATKTVLPRLRARIVLPMRKRPFLYKTAISEMI